MTNQQKDALFVLIKSLSSSEKRQFKLFVNRLDVNADAKFLALFNLMDKMKDYNEDDILKSNIVKKQQLANLKAHLYKQILVSLRLSPHNQNIKIQIREQIDFATILYNKALYKQSLKILDKVKNLALEHEEKNLAFEIVEFEKVIESQYITRSEKDRADQLSIQARDLSKENLITSKLSNLSLQLYSYFLKKGYVKSDEEIKTVDEYFNRHLPKIDLNKIGFREKLWYYKCFLWHSLLKQDFLSAFKYSRKWVDLFYEHPKMIIQNPVWFLKGNNYLFEALFFTRHLTLFREYQEKFTKMLEETDFPKNENVDSLMFLYYWNNRINYHYLEGSFEEGTLLVSKILKGIETRKYFIDEHHIMLLYYKIACLYFGIGKNEECIKYLSKIINNKNVVMREDLMCFSRILNLLAHYEAGIDEKLEDLIKETYRFLLNMNDLREVQKEIIKFIKSLEDLYPSELAAAWKKLYLHLKKYENHPYEKRAFLYLDFLSWLESKIENKPVLEIMKGKTKKLLR